MLDYGTFPDVSLNQSPNFENAKQQMRAILKEYATKSSDLFDGNGNILHLHDFGMNFYMMKI